MVCPCLKERGFVCKGEQGGSVHRDTHKDWSVKVISM